ncbi:MAG: hypothetical protein LBD29_07110 [Treponema sp.]|jgi:hypothetical protein|nr:hypothetical protein [Treponema sp.]
MKSFNIIRLNLYAPLIYRKDNNLMPFEMSADSEERLFCFTISPDHCQSIEPDDGRYLGDLLFSGTSVPGSSPEECELSSGTYLFVQIKNILNRNDVIRTAVETQKYGLGEELDLKSRFYLRYLFEEGKPITQFFRPYIAA